MAATNCKSMPFTVLALLVITRCAALSARPAVKAVQAHSNEAEVLLARAQQLRAEAATLEKELGVAKPEDSCECGGAGCPGCGGATLAAKELTATTKNNILSLGPKWKTQIWMDTAENDRPFLRTGWKLLEAGKAEVEAAVMGEDMEPGWRLTGDHHSEKLLECWFWVDGAPDKPPTKFLLKTTATPQAECETLLGYEKQAKEHLEACEARIREADSQDENINPLQYLLKLRERTLAVDELVSARQVAKEYEHHAARAKGATLSLNGIQYTLGPKGAVVASKGPGPKGEQVGSFASWLAPR
jgi:hypothetical protein